MDLVNTLLRNIPPVNRAWVLLYLTTSGLLTAKVISKTSLMFAPEKAFWGQPWRIITNFFTYDEFSLQELLMLWQLGNSSRMIESNFVTNMEHFPHRLNQLSESRKESMEGFIERNKSIDFLYFLVQIGSSLIIVDTIMYYRYKIFVGFLGQLLYSVLFYIEWREHPNAQLQMLFIPMRAVYIMFIFTFFPLIFSENIRGLLGELFSGNIKALASILTAYEIIPIYLKFGIGHFWWYLRSFSLDRIYKDYHKTRRSLRNQILSDYNVTGTNMIREGLSWFLMPPWYWLYYRKLLLRPEPMSETEPI